MLLSVSLQAAWRAPWFCPYTDHVEVHMKTTVEMVESACTPKTVTNLFACKCKMLLNTHTQLHLLNRYRVYPTCYR